MDYIKSNYIESVSLPALRHRRCLYQKV